MRYTHFMTPQDLVKALEGRGWKASIHKSLKGLVKVHPDGLFKCVDGRESDHDGDAMRGPKALGGVYAIAALRGKRDLKHLKPIVAEVRRKGYVPSVHGDDHGAVGCGFFKLWQTGQLPGLRPPNYDSAAGREEILSHDGAYEWLKGGHEEWFTVINLRSGTTFRPNPNDQRFVLDAWVAEDFKLPLTEYAVLAAETVERLRPAAMVAKIIV